MSTCFVRISGASTFVLMMVLLSGCSAGESATEVLGAITFQGKPITNGLINFQAEGARPLGGEIQSDGTYRYELPPGEYRVRIETPPLPSANVPQEAPAVSGSSVPAAASPVTQTPLPPRYASFETSGLTLTVGDESPQEHDFTLP